MIDPQELRLGNWIGRKKDDSSLAPVQVFSLDSHMINGLPLEDFEPLKLAGAHLLQAGFQYNGAIYFGLRNGNIEFAFDLDHNEHVTIDDHMGGQAILYRSFHFLHEVQNLIYDMACRELPLNL
jgi:hypothetical protein